jgi:hypothetical protein
VSTSEGLRKGARCVYLDTLSPQTRQSLWLGHKMGDDNPGQQGLGPLGKFAMGIVPLV